MRGTIDKVWENETKEGKPWRRLQIDDESYSLWEKKLFGVAQEGARVEFAFREKGDFKTITELAVAQVSDPYQEQGNGRGSDKQIQISRLSLLKTAVELLKDEGPADDRILNAVIRIAMRMEEYVMGTIDPGELEEQAPEQPAQARSLQRRDEIRDMIMEMYENDEEAAKGYLKKATGHSLMKHLTETDLANLKPVVDEDYQTWRVAQGGPFDPVEEG